MVIKLTSSGADRWLRRRALSGMTAAQAIVYYPMTNQMVWAVLMSSLGMLMGFRELFGETQFFASRTFAREVSDRVAYVHEGRKDGIMAASQAAGLGVTPRREVLGAPVFEIGA